MKVHSQGRNFWRLTYNWFIMGDESQERHKYQKIIQADPLQMFQVVDTDRPPFTHNLQCGRQYISMSLGVGGGGVKGRTWRFRPGCVKHCGALLCQQQPPCVNKGWLAKTLFWRYHGPLWQVGSAVNFHKDSHRDLPALPLPWGKLSRGVWLADDRVIEDVTGLPEISGPLFRVHVRPHRGFTGGAPPDSAYNYLGGTGCNYQHPLPPHRMTDFTRYTSHGSRRI